MNLSAAGLRSFLSRRLGYKQLAKACTAQPSGRHQAITTVVDAPSPPNYELRPYQEQCVEATLQGFLEDGFDRQLLSLPTGAGA
jgi:superfamily II DNA or RNA helicase